MRIDKVEYKNYQEWHKGRTDEAPLATLDYEYKGGRLLVSPNPSRRAVDASISYNGICYGKTFEIPCDIVWRENHYGFLGSMVKYEKEYNWRDLETLKLAEEFAKSMLDGLNLLSSRKPDMTITPNILPFAEQNTCSIGGKYDRRTAIKN